MAEPAVRFYYEGELPAHCSFFDATGNEESFEIKREFSLKDPGHIAIAMNLVDNPVFPLSTTPPKKET
jgi:hypothetical protein